MGRIGQGLLSPVIAEIFDHFPMGIVLVDADLMVQAANPMAGDILKSGDGLTRRGDRLAANNNSDTDALRELVRTCCDNPRQESECFPAPRRSSASPLLIRVAGTSKDISIVYIADPDRVRLPAPRALYQLFGLARREVELIRLLLKGQALEAVSRELNISVNTVRSYLRSSFAKTNMARQSDLIRLVMASPACLSIDADDG